MTADQHPDDVVVEPAPTDAQTLAEYRASVLASIRLLRAATLTLVVILVAGGIYVWSEARRTHDSLCVFRADLEARVAQTRDFLVEHPRGFAGIPAGTLQKSIDDQQRTINALANLDCPAAPTPTTPPRR